MVRKVLLYPQGKDAVDFNAPGDSLEETLRYLGKQPFKVYAVHVLVDGKNIKPTQENQSLIPPAEAKITIIQDCTSDHFYWRSWVVESK